MTALEQVREAAQSILDAGFNRHCHLPEAPALARLVLKMTAWNEEWLSGPFKRDIEKCAKEIAEAKSK